MKSVLLLFICLCSTKFSYCQATTEIKNATDDKVYVKVDAEAEFPGGDKAWANFLVRNLNTNVPADKGAKKGTYFVTLKFIVSKDGSISNVECIEDPGYGTCEECIRIIKKTPSTNRYCSRVS